MAETIRKIVAIDIPVVGHVGLTPQSYHRMGGHRKQGKALAPNSEAGSREKILADALAVENAGAFAIVVEGVDADLAKIITEKLSIPVIGIATGYACDGQILVTNDLLGISKKIPGFVNPAVNLRKISCEAIANYFLTLENIDKREDIYV